MPTWHNITVSVPDDVYRCARIWASHHNMSISAVFTKFLQNLQYRPATRLAITPADAREIDAALAKGIPIEETPWFLRNNPYGAKNWNANDHKLHFRNVMETLGKGVDWGPFTPPEEADSVKLQSCEGQPKPLENKPVKAEDQTPANPQPVSLPKSLETQNLSTEPATP